MAEDTDRLYRTKSASAAICVLPPSRASFPTKTAANPRCSDTDVAEDTDRLYRKASASARKSHTNTKITAEGCPSAVFVVK